MLLVGFVFGWISIRVALLSIIKSKVLIKESSGFWMKCYLKAIFLPFSTEFFEVLAAAYPIEPL